MHVIVPANVAEFFGFLIPVVMFDFIETFFGSEKEPKFNQET